MQNRTTKQNITHQNTNSKTQHNKYNTILQTPTDITQQTTTDITQQNTVPNKRKIGQNQAPSVSFLLN